MSDFINGQEHLEKKIRDLGALKKFSVFDGAIPTGDMLESRNGRYLPYVVFGFGGKTEAANRMLGIGSSRDDVKWTAFVAYCVGDSPATVRRLKDVIRTEFEGYLVDDSWGQLTEVLSGDFGISKPDPDLIPLRFGEPLVFKAITDA